MSVSRALPVGFLLAAWAFPALVAGALGWNGIWGSGSALVEFLIPIPVAGGVLHVPSFLALVFFVTTLNRWPDNVRSFMPWLAAAVFVAGLSLQLDSDRLLDALLTDYEPAGSIVRFDDNPLFHFVICDGLSAFLYSKMRGVQTPGQVWPALGLVPVAILGLSVVQREAAGPRFDIGGRLPGPDQRQVIHLVYLSGGYDEDAIRGWLEERAYFGRPWENVNFEQAAIYFTNSMGLSRSWEMPEFADSNTVATACFYEEDLSMSLQPGYRDCFEDRPTFGQRLDASRAAQPAGTDRQVADWMAHAEQCAEWQPPPADQPRWYEIERDDWCGMFLERYQQQLGEFEERLGADSADVVRAYGVAEQIDNRQGFE